MRGTCEPPQTAQEKGNGSATAVIGRSPKSIHHPRSVTVMEPKPNYGQFPSRPRHTAPDVEVKAVASETEGNHTMHRSRAHTHTHTKRRRSPTTFARTATMTIGDRKLPKRSGQENGQANLRYKVFPLALCWRRLVVFLRCGSAGFFCWHWPVSWPVSQEWCKTVSSPMLTR